ncbi:MAG: protein phosphatase CheZ [Holophagaceae bacterium]|nr:protein phosphatase CheZ [Holophagaceae bacterium]
MDQPNLNASQTNNDIDSADPELFLQQFRERNSSLDARLDKLLESIHQIREDIQEGAEIDLARLSKAAVDMMNGRVYQHVDIQAKGELGVIVKTFNQTLANLQQLDASVKDQSTRVPELAAQLDSITADTEQATQNVMNRLDTLMAKTEDAGHFFADLKRNVEEYKAEQEELVSGLTGFLDRAKNGENATNLAQDVLDFLFAFQVAPKPDSIDMERGQALLQTVSDEAFEILNALQFQDITRQKIEKVVQLLKQFRISLDRLLAIFKISEEPDTPAEGDIFEHRNVATQNNIFKTGVIASADTDSVDDIIAQFKAEG